MAHLKDCPSCGGKHRTLRQAKACYRRHHPQKWDIKMVK